MAVRIAVCARARLRLISRSTSPEDYMAEPRKRATTEEMRAREDEFLAVQRRDPASPYFAGGLAPQHGRRQFMLGSLAALGGAASLAPRRAAAAEVAGAAGREVPPDASKVQGYPLEETSYGDRSQFEKEMR